MHSRHKTHDSKLHSWKLIPCVILYLGQQKVVQNFSKSQMPHLSRCLHSGNLFRLRAPSYFVYLGPIKDSKLLRPQHPVAEHHCPETSSPLPGRIFQCFLFLAGDSLVPVEVLSSEGLLIATCPSASQVKLVLSAALSWPCLFPRPAL